MFNLISIDGYFADENGGIEWHHTDDEFNKFGMEQAKSFGTIIFGRTTYELFEDYWPNALKDPKTSSDDRQIAQTIEDATKIVFSKTLKEVSWNNSKVFSEINPNNVNAWKEKEGRDAVIFGSGTIVQQFTKLGLIDEYRILINPVILGKGKSLFENADMQELELTNTKVFKNGNVLATYIPTGLL